MLIFVLGWNCNYPILTEFGCDMIVNNQVRYQKPSVRQITLVNAKWTGLALEKELLALIVTIY